MHCEGGGGGQTDYGKFLNFFFYLNEGLPKALNETLILRKFLQFPKAKCPNCCLQIIGFKFLLYVSIKCYHHGSTTSGSSKSSSLWHMMRLHAKDKKSRRSSTIIKTYLILTLKPQVYNCTCVHVCRLMNVPQVWASWELFNFIRSFDILTPANITWEQSQDKAHQNHSLDLIKN